MAPAGKQLPNANEAISIVAFGSDLKPQPKPVLASIAAEDPDLYVQLGDVVFSDESKQAPDLPSLRSAYRELSKDPEFTSFRASVPMIVTWDDHDFGQNDGGGETSFTKTSPRHSSTVSGDMTADMNGIEVFTTSTASALVENEVR
jgi:alkaline phosphatase D